MGYYTIHLEPNASKICPIILPWGKYSYLRLPMGMAGSPNIFQALVGNVANMSPCVVATPTMSAENGRRHNVADVVTGFLAGSRVGLDIYLVFFYLDIYMVIFSLLNNREDVSIAPNLGTGCSNWQYYLHITRVPTWYAPFPLQYCTAVCEDCTWLWRIVTAAGKRHQTNSPLVLSSLSQVIICSF